MDEIKGMDLWRVEDGMLKALWDAFDRLGFMKQLGLLESGPEGAGRVTGPVDAPYCPGSEAGLRGDDTDLAIGWPLSAPPITSDRDARLPRPTGRRPVNPRRLRKLRDQAASTAGGPAARLEGARDDGLDLSAGA
jgi:hypothetical protein